MLKYRIDFCRLEAEDKPSGDILDGTTCYEVDTGKLFIYYKGEWYEQE